MTGPAIPEIRMEAVEFSQSGFTILKGASVDFPVGRTTVIMGTAGSGKSTLLKIAAGLFVPDSGKVYFRGTDMEKLTRPQEKEFRERTSFVFQNAALWSNQSIWNNVLFPLSVHRRHLDRAGSEARVREILAQVGYEESVSVRPAELSTGEQKLIGLARALVLDPEFVFMDEPTSSIDDTACERMYRILVGLKERGKGMAIVTHSGELAQLVADDIIAINDGVIVAGGTYDEMASTSSKEIRRIIGRLKPRQIS